GDTIYVDDYIYFFYPDTTLTYDMDGIIHFWNDTWRFEPRGPFDVLSVGVHESPWPRLRIYPNPASDAIRVELPEAFQNSEYAIRDALGRTVRSGRLLSSASV